MEINSSKRLTRPTNAICHTFLLHGDLCGTTRLVRLPVLLLGKKTPKLDRPFSYQSVKILKKSKDFKNKSKDNKNHNDQIQDMRKLMFKHQNKKGGKK